MHPAPESRRPPDRRALAWVAAQLGTPVVATTPLTGGITADVDRLTVGTGGSVVLRRWTDPATWPEGLVAREQAALQALAGTAVPAPRLLAADPTGEHAGVPSLLMTHVAGQVDLAARDRAAWTDELARTLAGIHRRPATLGARVVHLDRTPDLRWLTDAGLRRDGLAVVASLAELPADGSAGRGGDVFTHGDYQPFNVLWQDGRVSAVVDWPNAGTGPRGRDVGHAGLNLAVLLDAPAALDFVDRYEHHAGVAPDPRVVLRAVLAWDPEWQEFIPRQVAGRVRIDVAAMPERVADLVRCLLQRTG